MEYGDAARSLALIMRPHSGSARSLAKRWVMALALVGSAEARSYLSAIAGGG